MLSVVRGVIGRPGDCWGSPNGLSLGGMAYCVARSGKLQEQRWRGSLPLRNDDDPGEGAFGDVGGGAAGLSGLFGTGNGAMHKVLCGSRLSVRLRGEVPDPQVAGVLGGGALGYAHLPASRSLDRKQGPPRRRALGNAHRRPYFACSVHAND